VQHTCPLIHYSPVGQHCCAALPDLSIKWHLTFSQSSSSAHTSGPLQSVSPSLTHLCRWEGPDVGTCLVAGDEGQVLLHNQQSKVVS
jgi:hypothetical protein